MYKLLIIDDEPVIRAGLRTIVNWRSFDIEICGEAENGREGVRLCRELRPEMAIVDIKMPVMDGLQMIEEVRKEGGDCDFIVLSGYSEFRYAQKAIEHGVYGYLLKPIEQDELSAKVMQLRTAWSHKRNVTSGQTHNLDVPKPAAKGQPNFTFKSILDFISAHYGEDIKLELLAQLFNYNSSYLGKLFKSQTGHNFNAYLDEIRVEKAKQLLASGLKVYQVATLVGYSGVDYFHLKFKKATGESPSSYREKHKGQ